VAEAVVTFESPGETTLLTHSVTSYEGDAAGLVDQLAGLLDDCHEVTVPALGPSTFTLSALSFPALGDRSLAVHVRNELGAMAIGFDAVFVAAGPNLLLLFTGGVTPLPRNTLESFTRKALAKLT
jgi:hypothetical protein